MGLKIKNICVYMAIWLFKDLLPIEFMGNSNDLSTFGVF